MNEFYLLKVQRPDHPDIRRQWPKWCSETLVRLPDRKVYIVDVMQPSHMMARLPPIGSLECIEHDMFVFIDIDWGITNVSSSKQGDIYSWFKQAVLDRFDGKSMKLPAPIFPKICGKGRNMTLKLSDGRHYVIPTESKEFINTLQQLSRKTWATQEFLSLAIARVAEARDWDPEALILV